MHEHDPLPGHRAGHLFLAATTGFMGVYNLWAAGAGLHSGAIWIFTKKAAEQASRIGEPGLFWFTLSGRLGLGLMLAGVAVACLVKARHPPNG